MKLLLTALLPAFAAAALSSPSVTIDAGTLHGGQCEDGQNAVFYKAIPYAEPPIGELRFEPPKAYKKQFPQGKLDANTSAPTCLQFSDEFTPPKLSTSAFASEDCLYLNVWTPSHATNSSKLPVKVWIYGGSQTEGSISDPLYDGCNTAEDGSILVSINYRVGPLGFMALENAGIYGNQAIQDLILGLQWVQDNIAAFGGDPKKVLLFGQSAGGKNAYIIASLPQAPALINGAIAESGGGRPLSSNTTQQSVGASYARELQCSSGDKACLQSKTASDLLKAYKTDAFLTQGIGSYDALGVSSPGTHSFSPHVDGNVITEDPYNGEVQVPTVFGFTENEATVFAAEWAISSKEIPSSSLYKDFLRKNFGDAAGLVEKYYKPALFESATASIAASGAIPGYNKTSLAILFAMATVVTDSDYKCPVWNAASKAARKDIPAWTYEFTHNSTCTWLHTIDQKTISLFGGVHTAELPFVFGNLNNQYLPNGTCNSTSAEYHLGEQMMNSWTAMAENSDPSTEDIHWPRFHTTEKNFSSPGMIFGKSAVSGPIDFTGCDLWTRVDAILSASNTTATGTPGNGNGNSTSSAPPTQTNSAVTILPTSGCILALSMLFMALAGFI